MIRPLHDTYALATRHLRSGADSLARMDRRLLVDRRKSHAHDTYPKHRAPGMVCPDGGWYLLFRLPRIEERAAPLCGNKKRCACNRKDYADTDSPPLNDNDLAPLVSDDAWRVGPGTPSLWDGRCSRAESRRCGIRHFLPWIFAL